MYFINGIPFTFDDLEDLGESQEDMPSIKVIADNEILNFFFTKDIAKGMPTYPRPTIQIFLFINILNF